jgi:hypothetical protein
MYETQDRVLPLVTLTTEECAIVGGGMINQYPDGENPRAHGHQAGALVSMIGWRTFADVGL